MNSNTPVKTEKATLHLLCGKIASGKSTLADKLSASPGTLTISEDRWLAALYADEMHSVADYVRCAAKLKEAMKPHLVSLLQGGVSVVLDFPANTRANRDWMMSIVEASGADNRLHYMNVSDDVCRARLRARNAEGSHDFAATDAQFELITRYFTEPGVDEGFEVIEYR
ncbi:AAA family ATPase [Pantoea coffeiphila]|uniref:Cell division protein ZipA n=1 Tax=Pantoea coffeiphila TaxID=1465635 RepID=A0A2S9I6C2_9GAMM|nr:ATP-binding protein [Pantoea coffeiphila]PRD13352.1 cell division protein ZipA [Pantoea coffeiphila]